MFLNPIFLHELTDTAAALLPPVLLMTAVLAAPVLLAARRAGRAGRECALCLVLAAYLSAVLAQTGVPGLRELSFVPLLNLSLHIYSRSHFLLNGLMFLPLGLLLPLLWRRYRNPLRLLGAAFLMTCTIEFAQLFTSRTTDLMDIAANTAGAFAGYLPAVLCSEPAAAREKGSVWPLAALTLLLWMILL